MTSRLRNPVLKRLRWVAERYPADVLMLTADALSEAIGIHGTFIVHYQYPETWGAPAAHQPWEEAPATREQLPELILRHADAEFPRHTRYDRYLPWLARELDRLRGYYFSGSAQVNDVSFPGGIDPRWWTFAVSGARAQELRNRFRSIVDWAEAEKVDLSRYRYDEALEQAEEWATLRELGEVPQGRAVYRFDDGWTVQQLSRQDQLDAESAVMQHCLEDYGGGDPVTSYDGREVWIYSLRDPKGFPHATLEWDLQDSYVSQLRGKQNDVPKPEYLERMVGFRTDYLDLWGPELGFDAVDDPKGYDVFPRSRLLGTYSVKGAYGAKPDAKMLLYEGVWGRGTPRQADVFSPSAVDAWHDKALDEFDRWWEGVPWEAGREMTEEEMIRGEERARDEAWQDHLGQFVVSEELPREEAYHPLHWLAWRDHQVVLDDNEDEMVNWLAGKGWSPTCRFLGQRAANTVELRRRLMPPQAW